VHSANATAYLLIRFGIDQEAFQCLSQHAIYGPSFVSNGPIATCWRWFKLLL